MVGGAGGSGLGVPRCWMFDVGCSMLDVRCFRLGPIGARWWHPEARFLDFDVTRPLFSPPKMRFRGNARPHPGPLPQEREKHAQFPGIFTPRCGIASGGPTCFWRRTLL